MICSNSGAQDRRHSQGPLFAGFVVLAICVAVLCPKVQAAESQPVTVPEMHKLSVASKNRQTDVLQEVIVTAQRRRQNIQDVPIAVTSISPSTLKAAHIENVADLPELVPSLNISPSSGIVTTFVQGIGNPVTTAGNEPSVPVYIDGVYYARPITALFDLSSIQSVQVLQGPQGTLFGRNATGGVVLINTLNPGKRSAFEGTIGYGSYDTVHGQVYASMPITKKLAVNLAASGLRQGGGWGTNIHTGQPTYRNRYYNIRAKALWTPTHSTRVLLEGWYVGSHDDQGIYSRPFPGTVAGTPDGIHNGLPLPPGYPIPSQILPPLSFYDTNLNFNEHDEVRAYGGSARIEQSLKFANLVSISSVMGASECLYSEGDFSPLNFERYTLCPVNHQITQEVQLKSKSASKITWIVGLFYLNTLQGFNPTLINGQGPTNVGIENIAIVGEQRVKSYAGYGQVTIPVIDHSDVTLGLRYTKDDLNGVGTTTATFLPGVLAPTAVPVQTQANTFQKSFGRVTERIAVDHHFNSHVMTYFSFSTGYKAGTFNTLPLNSPALKPETVTAYDLGTKTTLIRGKLRLNADLFWNQIKDPQVQAQRNGLVALVNAQSARTRGVELQSTALLAPGLTFNLAANYVDATYLEFQGCPTYAYSTTSPGNLNQLFENCSGHQMPDVPKVVLTSSVQYIHDMRGAGVMSLFLSLRHQSGFAWDSDNVIREPPHTFLNGSVTFAPDALRHVTLRFWMDNITNVHYNINYYAQASGAAYESSPGAPRTFGGEFTYKY